ncbi:uncharacterized protein LOC122251781 [Penaeus japonicus]|uniref:uncharacterized protein LOC122251781 n=1 Tax=Penaeus japonicus TaxID=27405 RepID=UPI001C717359|nr:uncharacterized protein LOC122251781 [Penaeus japonicus]
MAIKQKVTLMLLWAALCGFGIVGAGKYAWGDALTEPNTLGPDGKEYPTKMISRLYAEREFGPPSGMRRGRAFMSTLHPETVRRNLLQGFYDANANEDHAATLRPQGRSMPDRDTSSSPTSDAGSSLKENLVRMSTSVKSSISTSTTSSSSSSSTTSACPKGPPARMCQTRYNTTAPMYGVSLTSGQPVTIVQKFPDLLQQVIFEVCESDTCDIVQGSCVQTYVPYLFLVIPLGPVTLTGQDYVLVESGCVCQPKYSQASSLPSPIEAISGGR